MLYRRRREQKAYDRTPKTDGCAFCAMSDTRLNPLPRRTLAETKHFTIVENMFPYRLWEYMDVLEHWMVVPKRHVHLWSELSVQERTELTDILCQYEDKGYSNYTRAPRNAVRTVAHMHTHLLKTSDKMPRLVVGMLKPYFLIKL